MNLRTNIEICLRILTVTKIPTVFLTRITMAIIYLTARTYASTFLRTVTASRIWMDFRIRMELLISTTMQTGLKISLIVVRERRKFSTIFRTMMAARMKGSTNRQADSINASYMFPIKSFLITFLLSLIQLIIFCRSFLTLNSRFPFTVTTGVIKPERWKKHRNVPKLSNDISTTVWL